MKGASSVVTLRREMIDAASQKCIQFNHLTEELNLPSLPGRDSQGQPTRVMSARTMHADSDIGQDSDSDEGADDATETKRFWARVRERHLSSFSRCPQSNMAEVNTLPLHWTVIQIGVTEDRSSMFISRQRPLQQAIVFFLPLKGRRESEDDEHLTFDDALKELRCIIDDSNDSTKRAVNVKNEDVQARTQWWDERRALDKRLQELLQNIEFCWLGAFKAWLALCSATSG